MEMTPPTEEEFRTYAFDLQLGTILPSYVIEDRIAHVDLLKRSGNANKHVKRLYDGLHEALKKAKSLERVQASAGE